MDKIKKFFAKKKLDAKFKLVGAGHRLDEAAPSHYPPRGAIPRPQQQPQARSSSDAQARAAEAALQRVSLGQDAKYSRSAQAIRAQVKKQLDAEKEGSVVAEPYHGPEEREFESAPILAVSGVFFTCELLGENLVLPRDVMAQQVEQLLREQLQDEPVVAASIMIHSLNPMRERRQEAIDVISKYLDNLITYPEEPKYRKIRMSNKVFAEKVVPIKGCYEFLQSVGFTPVTEGEETFLVISEDQCHDAGALIQAKEILTQGEPVPLKLHRNPSILRPSAVPLGELALPRDFFDRTAAELKQEQKEKLDEVEKLLMLRTREMRERDEIKRMYRYRYTLIRVRFPDGYLLQGTFSSAERFSAVEEFVHQHLCADWASFILKDPRGEALTPGRTHDRSLAELGLAPASVLHFEWDPDVAKDAAAAGYEFPRAYLKEDLLGEADEV